MQTWNLDSLNPTNLNLRKAPDCKIDQKDHLEYQEGLGSVLKQSLGVWGIAR